MANKENYSVKAEIEKALLKLLTQKEYTDITITDVVKEAKLHWFLSIEIFLLLQIFLRVLQNRPCRNLI